jgi:hypothetical protein
MFARRLPGQADLLMNIWRLLNACAFVMMAGCVSGSGPARLAPITAPLAAWSELGPNATLSVRAVYPTGATCRPLSVDGVSTSMELRSLPVRAEFADGDFPISVCSASITDRAKDVRLDGQRIPIRGTDLRRIVVLGDSGCRIKGEGTQACNDELKWPFRRIAVAAASVHPDLVIHVGDYHYRETRCQADGCSGPTGYGWDAWKADFFDPGKDLLAAAPWVMVRGNHEECRRAAKGWFLLLAPSIPLGVPCASGDDQESGDNFGAPFAVSLAKDLQLIVFDSARSGEETHAAAVVRRLQERFRQVDALAANAESSWFVSHHPVLGYSSGSPDTGISHMQEATKAVLGPRYLPSNTLLALHGHVHLFEAIGFADAHPVTIVAGMGGDNLDGSITVDPKVMPVAPNTSIATLVTESRFGFLVIDRESAKEWSMSFHDVGGSVYIRCKATGVALACSRAN